MITTLKATLKAPCSQYRPTMFGLVWRRCGIHSDLMRSDTVLGHVHRECGPNGHCWIAYHEPDTIETIAHSTRKDAEQLLLEWVIENVVLAPERYAALRRML